MAAGRPPVLLGRAGERQAFDRLLENLRGGQSAVLVVRGEAGVGKTALLHYCARQASGVRAAQIAGVEAEMELPFAALHQLCAPMFARLDNLPEPQRDALSVALGLASGEAPDRFLVGLAVLSLLSAVAEDRPLLCLVDDTQWLDAASGQVLGFVGRRLLAESVGIVLAVREPHTAPDFDGLPELPLGGLNDEAAGALLARAVPGRLDDRVRDRIVAETRGNPLALLELPRRMSAAELAGGFARPAAGDLRGHIEDHYLRRIGELPEVSQRLMLLAAADPVGDATLVWRAAQTLGIARNALAPAKDADLLEIGARVRFRHPLVRSAVYRAAPLGDRRRVHDALVEVSDPDGDADRRAWHRALAASGPDEDVAAELEHSAGRAQERGGLAAAAAFLERAASLTADPARRARRALAAAQAKHQAGAPEAALALLASAQAEPLDEMQRAQGEVLRAQIAFAAHRGSDALPLLLNAARRLQPQDTSLTRDIYLDALTAAVFAHRFASGGSALEVARAIRAARGSPSQPATAPDLFLDGWVCLIIDGYPLGMPVLKRALSSFWEGPTPSDEEMRWLWMACLTAYELCDYESWLQSSLRLVHLTRDAGALGQLPLALDSLAMANIYAGDFAGAAATIEEGQAISEAIGNSPPLHARVFLAACEGREAAASGLIEAATEAVVDRGEGMGLVVIQWAAALLYNGLCRYEDALVAGQQASAHAPDPTRGLADVVEAASRLERPEIAAGALERLSLRTRASGMDWALGIEARSRALLSEGAAAEALYLEAIEHLARTRIRPGLARAHLLYGEWLRREGRRRDAREQLRTAHRMFTDIGMEAFAERTRRELLATGATVRKRQTETRDDLTAQERQIARLARDGLSNPEIGARLFLSPRTVEWHLKKVFTKLGIRSRIGLHDALPGRDPEATPA